MSKSRGALEEQTAKVGGLLKASEQVSKAGIYAVTLISHPTEGILVSGEEEMCRIIREMLKTSGKEREFREMPVNGGMVNHFSSRAEKTKALKRLYSCPLPPLPMPFSEMKTHGLMLGQFAKLWDVEMQSAKCKVAKFIQKQMLFAQ